MNTKKERIVLIDDYAFDANKHTKAQIEGIVQAKFDSRTEPGTLKFTYDQTANGYKYTIDRNLRYGYRGNFIIDIDCSFLTGLPIEKFQVNLLDPNEKPLVYCIPGHNTDGYYVPIEEFERFYKELLGCGADSEQPQKVKVHACESFVNVDVEY